MGCGYSSKRFVVREGVAGQDELSLQVMQQLHLSPAHLDALYTAFCEMLPDHRECIGVDGFCAYFNVEVDTIAVKMVQSMHTMIPNCLNFCEMVGLLWDFLTRDPQSLGSFAFYLFDTGKNGTMDRKDVTSLVESLHHTTASKHSGVLKIVQEMMNYSIEIDIYDFHKYCRKHDKVCMLLVGFQTTLQEGILGKSIWKSLSKSRCRCNNQLNASYIRDLFKQVKTKRESRLEVEHEANERHSSLKNRRRARQSATEQKHTNTLLNFLSLGDKKMKKYPTTHASRSTPAPHRKHAIPAFFLTNKKETTNNDMDDGGSGGASTGDGSGKGRRSSGGSSTNASSGRRSSKTRTRSTKSSSLGGGETSKVYAFDDSENGTECDSVVSDIMSQDECDNIAEYRKNMLQKRRRHTQVPTPTYCPREDEGGGSSKKKPRRNTYHNVSTSRRHSSTKKRETSLPSSKNDSGEKIRSRNRLIDGYNKKVETQCEGVLKIQDFLVDDCGSSGKYLLSNNATSIRRNSSLSSSGSTKRRRC